MNDGIINLFNSTTISSGVAEPPTTKIKEKEALHRSEPPTNKLDSNGQITSDAGSEQKIDIPTEPNEETLLYHEIMTEEFENNDTRIAMIGNVDSGKSTLIGVLTNSALDDGRGAARATVLKHRHEQENGRTSAVTVEIMGYRGEDQVLATARNHAQRWMEIMEKSDHSVTLIDLCGHEKYLKTTLFGLTGLMPDYCLLVVGSNMGVQVGWSMSDALTSMIMILFYFSIFYFYYGFIFKC